MRVLLADYPHHHAKRAMEMEGIVVDTAENGAEADCKVSKASYEIIVLDLDLAKKDGLTLLKEWRRGGVDAHVIMTTARSSLEARVTALNAGADDFVTKPYDLKELMARLRAQMRRSRQNRDTVLRLFDFEIDFSSCAVRRAGKSIDLTPGEYSLLRYLVINRGSEVSRSMIWQHLRDQTEECTSNVIDVYIYYFRRKIDKGFALPLILTCWGKGYMFRGA